MLAWPLSTWIILLLATFLVSATLCWLAIHYANRRQLIDQPGRRRSHVVATPRGGGIGIVVAVLAGLLATMVGDPGSATGWPGREELALLSLGGGVLGILFGVAGGEGTTELRLGVGVVVELIDRVDRDVGRHRDRLVQTKGHRRDLLQPALVLVPVVLRDIVGLRRHDLDVAFGERGIGDAPLGEAGHLDGVARILKHLHLFAQSIGQGDASPYHLVCMSRVNPESQRQFNGFIKFCIFYLRQNT